MEKNLWMDTPNYTIEKTAVVGDAMEQLLSIVTLSEDIEYYIKQLKQKMYYVESYDSGMFDFAMLLQRILPLAQPIDIVPHDTYDLLAIDAVITSINNLSVSASHELVFRALYQQLLSYLYPEKQFLRSEKARDF